MRRTTPMRLCWSEPDAETTSRINRKTGGSVPGAIFNVLASVPGCLELFWNSLEPAFDSSLIRSAAGEVCRLASAGTVDMVSFSNHLDWLHEHGYSREDSRQIRYVTEAFFYLEPIYAVIAAVAVNWVQGHGRLKISEDKASHHKYPGTQFTGTIEYAGSYESVNCIEPIIQRYGTPLHPFYRAMAVWPEYLDMVWMQYESVLEQSIFIDAVKSIKGVLDILARGIPMNECRVDLNSVSPAFTATIMSCVDTSCEVIILTSALRRMFVRAESNARIKRIRENVNM